MKLINYRILVLIMMLFTGYASNAQTSASDNSSTTKQIL